MIQDSCKNCVHYHQHYSLGQRKLYRVYCGHCGLNARKKKQPDTAACENFASAPDNEQAFASKEYLSKELLQYLLHLELLPPIETPAEQ